MRNKSEKSFNILVLTTIKLSRNLSLLWITNSSINCHKMFSFVSYNLFSFLFSSRDLKFLLKKNIIEKLNTSELSNNLGTIGSLAYLNHNSINFLFESNFSFKKVTYSSSLIRSNNGNSSKCLTNQLCKSSTSVTL